MFLSIFTAPKVNKGEEYVKENWHQIIGGSEVTYTMVPFTVHQIPEAETFNLLGEGKTDEKEKKNDAKDKSVNREKPVTHLRSKITFSIMTDDVEMPIKEIPGELYYLVS